MTPRLLLAALVVLLSIWASMHAAADSTADGYREIFLELDDGIGESIQLHGEILENSIRPPACLETAFQQASRALRKLDKTLQSEHCDWEIDVSAGLNVDMSHLSMVRTFARIIVGDARRAMAQGDSERVAERIANMLRLVSHTGPDCLLSSLIRTAILNVTAELIQEADARSLISASEARGILKAASTLDAEDPTRFHEALESEKALSKSLIVDMFRFASEDGAEMDDEKKQEIRSLIEMTGMGDNPDLWMDGITDRMYADMDRYWADVFQVWENRRNPSFIQACDSLDQMVAEARYGPYMRLMGAALGNALKRTVEQNDSFGSDLDLLKSIESGNRVENRALNAALLYTQIVNIIQNEPDWRSKPVVCTEIVRLLQEAARCDVFRFPNPEDLSITLEKPVLLWTAPVVPWWLPAIDDVVGWLIENSDDGDSIASLEAAVLIISDLCEDLNIASSVVAAARTSQVLDVIEGRQSDELPTEDARRLLTVLREIPTSDPFGIRLSCDQTRLRLSMHIENLIERDILSNQTLPAEPDALMYASAWIRNLPGYDLTGIGFDLDCQWPDGESSKACSPLLQSSIDSAAHDGVQIMEAWELELAIPLEPSVSICEIDLENLIDDTRSRLLQIRRSLRNVLAKTTSNE
ncbi:MAG: hypothetical protein CMJ40_05155 [Phycisphaerae bacterium]|nr:hypothetical protein [Phycisphaerae bacterium]|tara:strand:- start:107 stop:2032 length:1926 start_codon:yes stop_codon:yes gene_type:complete